MNVCGIYERETKNNFGACFGLVLSFLVVSNPPGQCFTQMSIFSATSSTVVTFDNALNQMEICKKGVILEIEGSIRQEHKRVLFP